MKYKMDLKFRKKYIDLEGRLISSDIKSSKCINIHECNFVSKVALNNLSVSEDACMDVAGGLILSIIMLPH